MGNPALNLSKAIAAAESARATLEASGVVDLYLFGPRAKGTDTAASTWDFLIDFARPITPNEFDAIQNALLQGVKIQDSPTAAIYVTSPQYDRPSFTDWAVKSSKLIFQNSIPTG